MSTILLLMMLSGHTPTDSKCMHYKNYRCVQWQSNTQNQ